MFHCVFHCAFHCVTQRCARFTAFHSAARISLQPKVCCGKFPISNATKSSSGPINLQLVCENHPSSERKACKRLTTSLLAQHYETLLREGLRCRCRIITSNSNSVFSSRASCQNQAHQLGPPQYCSKRTTLALWLFMTEHWLGSQTDLMRHEYVRYFDTVRTVATYLILSCIFGW